MFVGQSPLVRVGDAWWIPYADGGSARARIVRGDRVRDAVLATTRGRTINGVHVAAWGDVAVASWVEVHGYSWAADSVHHVVLLDPETLAPASNRVDQAGFVASARPVPRDDGELLLVGGTGFHAGIVPTVGRVHCD